MSIDPNNPVVALCAAGMAVEGDVDAALYLNLGDACLAAGDVAAAHDAAVRAVAGIADLPEDGYRTFVAGGIERLQQRLAAAVSSSTPASR